MTLVIVVMKSNNLVRFCEVMYHALWIKHLGSNSVIAWRQLTHFKSREQECEDFLNLTCPCLSPCFIVTILMMIYWDLLWTRNYLNCSLSLSNIITVTIWVLCRWGNWKFRHIKCNDINSKRAELLSTLFGAKFPLLLCRCLLWA